MFECIGVCRNVLHPIKPLRTAQGRVSELSVCSNVLKCSIYIQYKCSSVLECVVYVLHPIKLLRTAQGRVSKLLVCSSVLECIVYDLAKWSVTYVSCTL